MIHTLFWNCRGIGNAPTITHLKKMLKQFHIDFVSLFEPKLPSTQITRIMLKLGMTGCWCNESSNSHIWIFWRNVDAAVLISEMQQASTFEVTVGQEKILITSVYAALEASQRRDLWNYVLHLSDTVSVPWCVGGDFNVILSPTEARGNFVFDYPAADDFRDFIECAGFSETEIVGDELSWSNLRKIEDLMFKKLDRVLFNNFWKLQFDCKITYDVLYASDHRAMVVDQVAARRNKPSHFVFQKMWLSHPQFQDFLIATWEGSLNACPLFNLAFKLTKLKKKLQTWNTEVFGDINKRYAQKMAQLETLENILSTDWSADALDTLKEKKREFLLAEQQLEIFQRQKSKETWLLEGDKNSKYFHSMIKDKRRIKYMAKLEENLRLQSSFTSVLDEGKKFFSNLLSAEETTPDVELLNVIPELVTSEWNENMCAVPDAEEIKLAVFSIGPDQAPGPDGFSAAFYQKCWNVVGTDVVAAVQEFFKGKILPKSWKATFIALIPKVETPATFKDMRPISLCCVHYKFVSKILATRLSKFLYMLISDEQGAYVKGRSIHESICLVQELTQSLNDGLRGGNLIVKLDMSKAFDRLDWSFLQSVLLKFGFSQSCLHLLRQCFMENQFSVLVEGESSEFFQSTRGVRQGDPMSPLLFILASEVLSRGYTEQLRLGLIKKYNVPSCDKIVSHSLFADDSIFFLNGVRVSLENFIKFLKRYQRPKVSFIAQK